MAGAWHGHPKVKGCQVEGESMVKLKGDPPEFQLNLLNLRKLSLKL